MRRFTLECLVTFAATWLSVCCIRFAVDFADSPWWFLWVAAACGLCLAAVVLLAALIAMVVTERS